MMEANAEFVREMLEEKIKEEVEQAFWDRYFCGGNLLKNPPVFIRGRFLVIRHQGGETRYAASFFPFAFSEYEREVEEMRQEVESAEAICDALAQAAECDY